MEERPVISLSWREGKYLDLWSVVHLLSGVLLGALATFTTLPFSSALVVAIALFIIYEWFEAALHIGEILENRVVDVIIAAVGFTYAYRFSESFLSREETLVFTFVLAMIVAMLSFLGWRAHRKRRQL